MACGVGATRRNAGRDSKGFPARTYFTAMAKAVRFDFVGPMRAPRTLPDGSIRVPAYIARTGVQLYRYSDGTEIREYRPPTEVFSPESLETWPGLAVTVDHPDNPVTTENWNQVAVGHVTDTVAKDGAFLTTDIIVKDAVTIAKIAAGELIEVSAGYLVDIDPTPGVTPEGEEYDQVQRNVIGNHVALGPTNWARAGSNVRLYSGDSKDGPRSAVSYSSDASDETANGDTTEMDPKLVGKATRKDAEAAGGAENAAPATVSVIPLSEYEKVCAQRDALASQIEQSKASANAADSLLNERVAVRVAALKVDSKIDTTKDDRTVMVAAIVAIDPAFKSDGRSDDYIRARFDMALESAAATGTRADTRTGPAFDALRSLGANGPGKPATDGPASRDDADDGNAIERAKLAMRERNARAWTKAQAGNGVK